MAAPALAKRASRATKCPGCVASTAGYHPVEEVAGSAAPSRRACPPARNGRCRADAARHWADRADRGRRRRPGRSCRSCPRRSASAAGARGRTPGIADRAARWCRSRGTGRAGCRGCRAGPAAPGRAASCPGRCARRRSRRRCTGIWWSRAPPGRSAPAVRWPSRRPNRP